jgi:LysM repeat protein
MRPKPIVLAGTLAMVLLTSSIGVPHAAASDRMVVVRAGQTLSQIATEHGMTVARLMRLNHLSDPNRIYAGQRLRLRWSPQHHIAGQPQAHRRLITHRVAYGETLTGIAVHYNVSIERLVRRNHLENASRIYAGQLLRIRAVLSGHASRQQPARRGSFVTHIVRLAETLSGIALRYRVSVDAIAAANDIANPSLILVGQELRVPNHGGTSRHATSHRHTGRQRAVNRRMPVEMATLVARRADIGRLIREEARAQHLPPALAKAVAWQESGWQPRIVSSAGAIGVMQLLPATADWVSATMLGERVNLWSARSNVRAGVALLKHYLHRYDGNRPLSLAAYYQGQAGTDRHGIYPVSRPYIDSILILESMFAGR